MVRRRDYAGLSCQPARLTRARARRPIDRMPPPGLEEVMEDTLKFDNGDVYKARARSGRPARGSVTASRPPVPAR